MIDIRQICPYTGLRSFSEEESLYFKGREDDIDQASSQLQRNKFLMLTGASGDGKSSLIYAGIIPNARAGFIKAKYSNWCVADFRPERTPFQNLCKAIARELEITNIHTVQAELNHGFSALVDLYKNSKKYIDTNSSGWQNADVSSKAKMKNQASNLVILVDQFEEFFTNPENYRNGAPSKDSNLVVNILLETARIALEEDLPIYIIFTMRSDYTGQCAAFRGLPEYIGFSQFFVPHLNRTQLQQVIEEPAVLNGNHITRRLTERLIHDLTEGVDQLPILQHALNQIWMAADQGDEEMDLIHYAMVGGMGIDELPEEHATRFSAWFEKLPPEIKACYVMPSLQNVLDTHTNKLYINSAWYYKEKTGKNLSSTDARLIIKTVFTCLTKIDQGRAVRNRMTLEEITHILGMPQFDAHVVGAVMNAFREPGNTFVRPFINPEHPESLDLQPRQVLDITHESLIRNWRYLGQWAKEEYDSFSIYVDYEQQLKRWVNSDKSRSFLLPIGPLTFFENWYQKAKPNAWWIARYLPEGTNLSKEEAKLAKATDTISDADEFLVKSARKHVITRTLVRFGSKRIAITIGLLILLTLTSFVVKSFYSKQSGQVMNSIHQQTLQLVNNPKVGLSSSSNLVCEELKIGKITLDEVAAAIPDTIRKINVINGIAALLIYQGHDQPKKEIHEALSISDSLLNLIPIKINDPLKLTKTITEINDLRANLELANFYSSDPVIDVMRKRNASRSAAWAMKVIESAPAGFNDMLPLTVSLENGINYKEFSIEQLNKLIKILSPFEGGLNSEWLKTNFARDELMQRGFLGYGFKFNGLYQELAYLYAAIGNSERALQCIDTLMRYNDNYYLGDYSSGADNASNIASVFYKYGKETELTAFVKGYSNKKGIREIEFYQRLIDRTIPSSSLASSLDLYWFMDVKVNLNVQFMSRAERLYFSNHYRESIESTVADASERNFLLALSYKDEGLLNSISKEAPAKGELTINELFSAAVNYYKKVSQAYLDVQEFYVGTGTIDEVKHPHKFLFLYPDIRTPFHPGEPRTFFYYYLTDEFLKYILDNNLFEMFYPGEKEIEYISGWLSDFHSKQFTINSYYGEKPKYDVLKQLAEKLSSNPVFADIDFNILYLYMGDYAQHQTDTAMMFYSYQKIQKDKLLNVLRSKEYDGLINDQAFRLIGIAIKGLATSGHLDMGLSFIRVFKNPINRSSLYSYVAIHLLSEKFLGGLANQFADSALAESKRVEDTRKGQPNLSLLAEAKALQHPNGNTKEVSGTIKNIPEKLIAICMISRAYAFHEELYRARAFAPQFISDADMGYFLWSLLYGHSMGQKIEPPEWKSFDDNYTTIDTDYIRFLDEDN